MPIAQRGTASVVAPTSGTITLNKPTGVVSGDVLIAQIAIRPTQIGTLSPPAGFSVIQSSTVGSTVSMVSYIKMAGGSEGSSYAFTHSVDTAMGILTAWSGTAGTVNASAQNNDSVASTTQTAPAVTPSANDALILVLGTRFGPTSTTAPTNYTEVADSNTNYASATFYRVLSGGAGVSTGTIDYTTSGSEVSTNHTIALIPQPSLSLPVGDIFLDGLTPAIASEQIVSLPVGDIALEGPNFSFAQSQFLDLPVGDIALEGPGPTDALYGIDLPVGDIALDAPGPVDAWTPTATLTREMVATPAGSYAAEVIATDMSGSVHLDWNPSSGAGACAVTPGETVFLAREYRIFDSDAALHDVTLKARFYNSGVFVSELTVDTDMGIAEGSAFRRALGNVVVPATATHVVNRLSVNAQGTGRATYTVRQDAAMIVPNHTGQPEYFDGSTALGVWTGTAHASTSNQLFPPSGIRWIWHGELHVGGRTIFADDFDFGVLGTDGETPINIGGAGVDAPVGAAAVSGLLFIGGGWIYGGSRKTASYSAGTVAVTQGSATVNKAAGGFTANVDAGMLFQIGNERVYVVEEVVSNTQIRLSEPYVGSNNASAAYVLHAIYQITASDPYVSAPIYAAASDRLVACEDEHVYFAEFANPHNWPETDFHSLPGGIEIIGASYLRGTLIVFTSQGFWTITNPLADLTDEIGNVQHRIEHPNQDIILWGDQGITSWRNSLIACAVDGVWIVDSISAPVKISDPIEPLYATYVQQGRIPGGCVVHNNHLFLPILSQTGDDVVELFICRLDRPVATRLGTIFPWTRIEGDGAKIAAGTNVVDPSTHRTRGYGALNNPNHPRIVDFTAIYEPGEAHLQDANGEPIECELVTRDYFTGPGNLNHVRRTRWRYELEGHDATEPVIRAAYSTGARKAGVTEWGLFDWGESEWADPDENEWFALAGEAPADPDGYTPYIFRVNKRARWIRLRARTSDAYKTLVLRTIELYQRPAERSD